MAPANTQIKKLERPQLPKKKMSNMRAMMMFGVALCLSIPIFVFSIFPITAPIMLGVGSGVYAQHETGSAVIGEFVGWAAGISTTVAEFLSGVGVEFVDLIGIIMAVALTFLGWLLFFIWFTFARISLIGGGGANKRFATVIASFIIGLIPFIDIIPSLLIGIVLIILSVRSEDKKRFATYEKRLKEYEKQQKNMMATRKAVAMRKFTQQPATQ